MIKIDRHEKQVRIRIEHGAYYNDAELWFYWNCNSELYAQLLTQQLNRHLDDRVQAIRKEEYEKGWKDAKAHRTKETWFSPLLKLFR